MSDYQALNYTKVKVWGIGSYFQFTEIVLVGSIDPVAYCDGYKLDTSIQSVTASGQYLHTVIQDCFLFVSIRVSDMEIRRVTTTGSPGQSCVVEAFQNYLGNSNKVKKTNGTEDCSVLCKAEETCSHWSYEIKTQECSLHSEFYGDEPNTKFVSGTRCEGISPTVCMYTELDQEYLHCLEEHWAKFDITNLDSTYTCPVLSNFVGCLTELDCTDLLPQHLKVFRAEACNFAFCEKDLDMYQSCISDFNAAPMPSSDSVSCSAMAQFEHCIAICDLSNYQQSLKDDCDENIDTNEENESSSTIGSTFVLMLAIVLSSVLICMIMCYLVVYRKRKSMAQVVKRRPENKTDPAYRSTSVQIGSRTYTPGRSESLDILGRPKRDALGRPKRKPERSGEPAWKRTTVERSDSAMSARMKKDPASIVGNDSAAPAGTSTHLGVNDTGTDTVKISETSIQGLTNTPSLGGDHLRSVSAARDPSLDTHV